MAGEVVGDFEPADAFFVEDVEGGLQGLGVVEGADVEVGLAGEAVRLVGERGAAGGAEAALDAGRGPEHGPLAPGERDRLRGGADEHRDRRAGAAPAGRAVAIAGPERRGADAVAHPAAEAAAFEGERRHGVQAASAWTAGRPRTLMRQSRRESALPVATPMGVAACMVCSVSHTTRSPAAYLWR